MTLYIGIDGGGTKTAFTCYDEQGTEVISFVKPSCHVLQVTKECAVAILKEGITRIQQVRSRQEALYICAGLAGYGNNIEVRKRIEAVCEESFAPHAYCIKNDGEIAHAGALEGMDGILVIAGTGSLALSKSQGVIRRSGGWGYQLGDEGSAYWIAKQLCQEYTKQCDDRHPKTKLVAAIKEACQLVNDYDLIPYINRCTRDEVAQLAQVAFALAQDQDVFAIQLYQAAAKELAELIHAQAKHFSGSCIVSYTGGVWKSQAFLMDPLRQALADHIHIQEPLHPPVYGAYLIAKEMAQS